MGDKYFINTKPRTDGTYSIHKEGCPFLPGRGKHIFLGKFQSVKSAFGEGQKYFKAAVICRFCIKEYRPEISCRIFPGTFRKSGFGSTGILNDSGHINSLLYCKN